MPAVKYDNRKTWAYRGLQPLQDRRNHPAAVPDGSFVRLIGVDGRFIGSLRRFPGFKQLVSLQDVPVIVPGDTSGLPSHHVMGNLPVDAGSGGGRKGWTHRSIQYLAAGSMPGSFTAPLLLGTIRWPHPHPSSTLTQPLGPLQLSAAPITDVWFFKHVSVRPADSAVTLRGFVTAHPYADGAILRGVLRFVYWDPDSASWKSQVLLREVDGSAVFLSTNTFGGQQTFINATSEIDCAAGGPFLWFCITQQVAGQVIGVRRSVFVQKLNGLNWYYTEFGPLSMTAPPAPQIDPPTAQGGIVDDGQINKKVSWRLRLFSGRKNVEGPILSAAGGLLDMTLPGAPGTLPRGYRDIRYNDGGSLPNLSTQFRDDDRLDPKLRSYRSIDSNFFESAGVEISALTTGTLFREKEISVRSRDLPFNPPLDSADLAGYNTQGAGSGGGNVGGPFNGGWHVTVGNVADTALVTFNRINPFTDDTALAPARLVRLLSYQGTLLRVGTFPIPAAGITFDRDRILSWGSLREYAPEECRVSNSTPLGDGQDEVVLSLVRAGDYAFAIGDTSIYRIHKNGILLAINEIATLAGGTGRYAALGIGTSLFYVNPTGVYVVDGPTGEFQLIAATDRIIQDEWTGTLASVRMAYDNRLGALFILNDDLDECLVLWNNTGAITTLKDMPFRFGTQGINPPDAGFNRAFFVTRQGAVYTPNARDEASDAQTMMGGVTADGGLPIRYNGTVLIAGADGANTRITIDAATAVLPGSSVQGFKVYFLSGVYDGRAFEAVGGDAISVQLGGVLDPLPAVGDRFSIAPVVYEVVGPPLRAGVPDEELFLRKTATAMNHSTVLRGGEVGEDNVNLKMRYRLYARGNLESPVLEEEAPMSVDPSKNCVAMAQAGPLLYPAWRNLASNTDFELLGGEVRGAAAVSTAESSPG